MVHVFIINPEYNDKGFADGLRETLARIPDLNYYVFTTGVAGDETRIASTVEDIFEGEQLRIYSCGGTLAARNILDGINDISRIELAIIPTQPVNFLRAFGSQEPFSDVEQLINGSVTRVDYFKTNHGVALNSVSFGMDSYSYKCYDNLVGMYIFGRQFPWYFANIYAILATPNYMYNVEYNGRTFSRRAMEINMYNVPVTGRNVTFTDDYSVTDGEATFMMVSRFGVIGRIVYAIKAMNRSVKFSEDDERNTLCSTSHARVRHLNGAPIWGCLDGKLIFASDWKIDVIKQGLKLVVPTGVTYERL